MLSDQKIDNEIYFDVKSRFFQYQQECESFISDVSDEFVLIAFLTLINIVLNVLMHVKSIVFVSYKIENTNNAIMIDHRCVVMNCDDRQLHDFRYVDLILMIENAVF